MKRPASSVLLGAGVGAAAAWLLYFRNPGRSVSTAIQDLLGVLGSQVDLDSTQSRMARIIAYEFDRAGLSHMVQAAIVNAWHESRLNPVASGDNGKSIGLFQLHEAGAGKGMTVAQREDPELNTRRIIEEAMSRGALSTRGKSNGDLAEWFARNVERCWECGYGGGSGQLSARRSSVDKLFGAGAANKVP